MKEATGLEHEKTSPPWEENMAGDFRNKGLDMGSGPVGRTLLRLALPSMASMLFHTLFYLVDTLFIAWLGGAPLAAASLTFPLLFISFALTNGMAVGCTALVSRNLGANDLASARTTARAGLLLTLLLSLTTMPLLYRPFSDIFFEALGGSGTVLEECYRYNSWILLGMPFMAYSILADSTFRSQGNTVVPLVSMVLGNGLNALLDPLFMFTFGLGIAGASLATLVGRIASILYVSAALRRSSDIALPLFPLWEPGFATAWRRIIAVGLPVSLSQSSMSLGMAGVNKVLSMFGSDAIGAWMLGNRIEGLAFLPVFGINAALIPFVGHNLGKGDLRRIREGVRLAATTNTIMMLVVGAFIFAFPHPLLALFRPDPNVATMAAASIRASVTGYVFTALDITYNGFFQGTGYTLFGMTVQIVRTLAVRAPAAYLFATIWGIDGVWWCQPLSALVAFSLSLVFLTIAQKRIEKFHVPSS
jgi:putative MATE family efflux protein